MGDSYSDIDYPFQEECYLLIGIMMEIHRILGKGFSEIVYKDALEFELRNRNINYEREREFSVNYKGTILKHKFYADFVVDDKVIIEVKSKSELINEHYAQVLNYLAISKLGIGLLINFNEKSLQYKRIIRSY
ncbi:NADH:ubiquinone oxidoreductase [Pedobacter ginsenosidimutans]|uniref:NADH:ubiquinone oxidoreductase n=1 Tax=Pedobacter ginsenosidimutans TaxID=687842 RepID=A0A0T5VSU3_9SPHI|nr:GxxExxY protein [Pedobacter ginsenosidimutans]KRT16939.1 NADH:ubiquinone oxidoreductase [Pedobacter ginsenosidimutans]